MKNNLYNFLLILSILLAPYTAYGEKIEFKNGQTVEGSVINETDSLITVQFSYGIMSFDKKDIMSIIPTISTKQENTSEATTLKIDTKDAHSTTGALSPGSAKNSVESEPLDTLPTSQFSDIRLPDQDKSFIAFFGNKQSFQQAFLSYRKQVKEDPNNIEARYKLGISYFYLKDYERAILELITVLEQKMNDPIAKRYLAYSYYHTGNYNAAIGIFEELLTTKPFDTKLREQLATCYYHNNRLEDAAREYEKVLARQSSAYTTHIMLSKIYSELKNARKSKYHRDIASALKE